MVRDLAHANETVTKSLPGGLPRKALKRITRNVLKRRTMRLWTNWEKEMVSSSPTITVSEVEYKGRQSNVILTNQGESTLKIFGVS